MLERGRIYNYTTQHISHQYLDALTLAAKGAAQAGTRVLRASESVNLFRAVSPDEFEDIFRIGGFRPRPDGRSLEAKEFGLNLEETIKFADTYSDLAAVVKVTVPRELLNSLDTTIVDSAIFRSGTVIVQFKKLGVFNRSIIKIEQAF
ncbi:hypothetical protein [Gloeobacter morelensis]|uniref:Uncharacterized protein n=1 Tax=Gloeobacter morelensis MG652769 TaxID=2781736 RepID=A0ABY3PKP7_9CYAN|nr:hypothetical protein [Gloeobacter morelensis]UFP94211.1 hypothetical protein ISF26_21020 [Gloeobacter morelensis MG652769]